MLYKISENINSSKIFIINRSEIEGRLDPLYYNSNLTKYINNYPSVRLETVCLNFKSGFGAGKDDQVSDQDGIIQIRPTNLDKDGMLIFDKNVYVPSNVKVEFVKKGAVLFNNTNSQELVGKTAILESNGSYYTSNHITSITVDTDVIIPKYLWFILNLYQKSKVFYSICTNWNNQSGVGLDVLKSIKIPLPDIAIQKNIVKKIELAYIKRSEKISDANDLIKSIDTYLLNELGIILPKKDNSLKNRIFITNLNKVSGGRYDPKLYDNNTTALKNAILELDSNIAKVIQLSDYIVESVAGDWGIEFDDESEDYTKCLVVRATEFDNIYNLNLNNSRVKYRYIKTEKLEKIDIKTDDLLIEKSGGSPDQPVGRISIITQDMVDNHQLCYSNFIHKIRVDSTVLDPQYMFCYLKVMHNIKLTESMQSQTNGIRNLIMKEYLQQPIIVPITEFGDIDINKQIEIADHIANIRLKAKQLQQEAKDTLEKAKIEVEKIILG